MLATIPKKAPKHDRGVVPVLQKAAFGADTNDIRATPDGRLDVLDVLENVMTTRDAGRQALNAILEKVFPIEVDQTGIPQGTQAPVNPIGFGPEAFSRVRWAKAKGGFDSIVAKQNVCDAIVASLQTRGGAEIRSSLATMVRRWLQEKQGMTQEEIQAAEQPTTNPQLTNSMAAAVGAVVLPETLQQQTPTGPTVTIGDSNTNPVVNGGDVNVTVHQPTPPKSSSSADGNELQATGPPIALLLEVAGNINHPAHGWAMGMLGSVQKTAEAHADKEVEYVAQEREKTKQVHEHTEQERAKTKQVQTEAAKVEDERVDAKEARKRKMAIDESEWERTSKMRTIKSTFAIAREMGQATPALREQLAARLTSNEIVASDDHGAAQPPPEIETAKSYAERILGRPLNDTDVIKKLRIDVNAAYHRVFKKPASLVLPQVREGTSLVASFHARELAHPALHTVWPR